MKSLIAIILLFYGTNSFCQDSSFYTDTLNGFTIEIPKNWKIQTSKTMGPGMKLIVRQPNEESQSTFLTNYNVNLVAMVNSNIDSSYIDMKNTISKRSGYQFLSELDTTIHGIRYRWLLEKHSNSQTKEPMISLVLLGYKNDIAYMVTFATLEALFPQNELLFRRIAASFSL